MTTQGPGAGTTPPINKRKVPADIVFCVDCTISMEPCFNGLIRHLADFVQGLQTKNEVDYRLRLIEYRDLKEGEPTVARDFTPDANEFLSQLSSLTPSGGGDIPESTLDAIYTALDSPWRKNTHKAVIVFTDAPPHPELEGTTVPPGTGTDIETIINLLEGQRAWFYLISVEDPLYDRFHNREKTFLYLYPNDDSRYEGLKAVDFAKVLEWLGRSISNTSTII